MLNSKWAQFRRLSPSNARLRHNTPYWLSSVVFLAMRMNFPVPLPNFRVMAEEIPVLEFREIALQHTELSGCFLYRFAELGLN